MINLFELVEEIDKKFLEKYYEIFESMEEKHITNRTISNSRTENWNFVFMSPIQDRRFIINFFT